MTSNWSQTRPSPQDTSKVSSVHEKQALMDGLQLGSKSARCHDDRLWFSDRGAQKVITLNLDCKSTWPVASHSLMASLRRPIFNADPRGVLRQEAAAFDIAASGLPNPACVVRSRREFPRRVLAWTPKTPSGAGISLTSAACAFHKGGEVCKRSTWTAVALLACSGTRAKHL
jgi:hypothetical protein